MSNSLIGLFNEFFDSRMENFETGFPCKISRVNGDGTVDVRPCIKNCLKNMQLEPTNEGELREIRGVPVLWPGTGCVIVEYKLNVGDPVFCVSSSRDLRGWIDGGWKGGPYDPLSFSGNDLNDLLAIPCRRSEHGETKTRIYIDDTGAVTLETEKKVKLDCDFVGISGNLVVDGEVQAGGEISANMKSVPASLGTHIHDTAVGPSSPQTTTPPPVPIVEPS